jgi:hypothetical protein
MIDLSNVTLVTIDGTGNDLNAIKALKYSTKDINFKSVLYLTAGNYKPNFCKTTNIPRLSVDEYQKFCLTELTNHVDSDYIILIQSDGFIINPNVWDNDFLNYDYIGGPWPIELLRGSYKYIKLVRDIEHQTQFLSKNAGGLVGNGGFTLRSKRLLTYTQKLYKDEYYSIPEDNVISIILRQELENNGLKIPYDVDFASKFSCESKDINGKSYSPDNSFGFHGRLPHPEKINLLNTIKLEELL